MILISGDKFKRLQGGKLVYRSMDDLFNKIPLPINPFVLITHGGDIPASEYKHILEMPNLIHWFATNSSLRSQKVTAIPIGLDYSLSAEREAIFSEVMAMDIERSKDIYCNFKEHHWVEERQRCRHAMNENGLVMSSSLPYREYLMELKAHKFCLCPIGNGIDTFRLWECLYLGVVPIVTDYINGGNIAVKQYDEYFYHTLPICFIRSWEKFNYRDFNINRYNHIISTTSKKFLDFGYWSKLILSK